MNKKWASFGIFLCICLSGCAKTPPSDTQWADLKNIKEGSFSIANAEAYQIVEIDRELEFSTAPFDLKMWNLSGFFENPKYLSFDSKTEWPDVLQTYMDFDAIMRTGMNPGLGIQTLHREGMNGKNVGIAILGSAPIVWHQEYEKNTKLYERIGCSDREAQRKGTALASLTVGKKVGTAPAASLYYIASTFERKMGAEYETDFSVMAEGIQRILTINSELDEENKIRVIVIPQGYSQGENGWEEAEQARKESQKRGILVISPNSLKEYGVTLLGLGRTLEADPDDVHSYIPSADWAEDFYANPSVYQKENLLLVPMDARTAAGNTGNNDTTGKEVYTFSAAGLGVETYAWLTGLYAMCVQVKPEITAEEFFYLAGKTGDAITIEKDGQNYELKTIINPRRLLNVLQNSKE